MNARSFYVVARYDHVTDRRGAERQITVKAGHNKGKQYQYSSTRQTERQTAPLRKLYAAWDREDCVNA